jgi:hypothetical protein
MANVERRWASPAAAVIAFCLTLVLVAPPTSPPHSAAVPASIVADGLAALAGHGFLGLVAVVGLFFAAKIMIRRPTLRVQRVTTPSRQINAA